MTEIKHIDSLITPYGDSHTDTPSIPPVSIHIDHQDTQPTNTHTDTH